MLIQNGAIVEYQGSWPSVFHLGTSSISGNIATVTAALARDGLSVLGQSNDAGIISFSSSYNVTLKLQVNNGLGYNSEDDIISIVRHEVYQAIGDFPLADSVPTVQQPTGPNGNGASTSAPIPTGKPPIVNPPPPPSGTSFLDSLKQLGNNSLFTVAGLWLGLIVAVLLIASPTARLARR